MSSVQISKDTTAILVEVTSTTSLDTCKTIMDELLYKMLELGLGGENAREVTGGAAAKGSDSESEDEGVMFRETGAAGKSSNRLVVEQVKIVDFEERLKVLYPSRTDLNSDQIEVIRH